MVVIPTALSAAAILCCPSTRGFTQREVAHQARLFYGVLQDEGVRFSSSISQERQLKRIIKETLELFQKEKLIQRVSIEQEDGEEEEEILYEIQDRNRRRLDYYKNSILHHLLPCAFVSASLLSAAGSRVSLRRIMIDAGFLRDLFGQEFVLLPEEDLEERIRLTLDHMVTLNLVRPVPDGFAVPTGRRQDLLSFARLIQSYFESYFVVGSSLKHIARRRLSQRRFLWRMRFTGHRLYQTGKIQLPESLSTINYTNAIQYLVDKRILLRQVDKTFVEGTYFSLTRERRKIHWGRTKGFLKIYR
jgi:glycerol-3-phosphate O-acyltransferase